MTIPSASVARLATVTASTKRSPGVSGGKRGTPALNIASLKCTPLDPVQAETAFRAGLESPFGLLGTFVDADLDIIQGDILVVDEIEYPIKALEKWGWRRGESNFFYLILEALRK
jgi:hypothetical protein